MNTDLPDLTRTAQALAAYDAFDVRYEETVEKLTPSEALAMLDELERLGAAVGRAFGQDTVDRNNPDTCADLVRPGPRNPGAGSRPSFVRRMVAQWKERT